MAGELLRLGTDGIVPVQWTVTKESKLGTLEGYASLFGVVDDQDDVAMPGMFKRTLARWKQSGRRLPLVDGHDLTNDSVIGSFDGNEEDPYGLAVKATFASTPRAQERRVQAREGHINGLSIFGNVIQAGSVTVAGKVRRALKEVHLLHIGLTPIPALMGATATAKSAEPAREVIEVRISEQWAADMRTALQIGNAQVQKAAVDLLIQNYKPTDPLAEEPASDDPSTIDSRDDSASYALSIIGESGLGESPPGGNSGDPLADLLAPLETAGTNTELDRLEAELKQMGQGNV